MEFTNESVSSISIVSCLIWWTAFHKTEIDSNGTFARVTAGSGRRGDLFVVFHHNELPK
jgi:hypothetical protein